MPKFASVLQSKPCARRFTGVPTMYESFFGLRERPFDLGANLRFLYLPEAHREAFDTLRYAINSRKGVTVLTGDAGTGKTTTIRAATDGLDERVHVVHMTNPRLTREEFYALLSRGFGLAIGAEPSKTECLLALEDHLVTSSQSGQHWALIVDEAQSLSDELVEEIRLLTNLEAAQRLSLTIILAGQPEFAERLDSHAFRHLKQRVALRCSLRALTLSETAGYIAARIRVAGGAANRLFTREAVQAIHAVSGGIPRIISVLCDNALVAGFAAGQKPVTRSIVEVVSSEFRYEVSPPRPESALSHDPHASQHTPATPNLDTTVASTPPASIPDHAGSSATPIASPSLFGFWRSR